MEKDCDGIGYTCLYMQYLILTMVWVGILLDFNMNLLDYFSL